MPLDECLWRQQVLEAQVESTLRQRGDVTGLVALDAAIGEQVIGDILGETFPEEAQRSLALIGRPFGQRRRPVLRTRAVAWGLPRSSRHYSTPPPTKNGPASTMNVIGRAAA